MDRQKVENDKKPRGMNKEKEVERKKEIPYIITDGRQKEGKETKEQKKGYRKKRKKYKKKNLVLGARVKESVERKEEKRKNLRLKDSQSVKDESFSEAERKQKKKNPKWKEIPHITTNGQATKRTEKESKIKERKRKGKRQERIKNEK